jgi:hypothetical protein
MRTDKWNPGRILEVSGSYWQTCTLHAAVKLDLFTRLGADELDGEETAQRLGGDPRGVTMLLNALVAMNLLARSGAKYSNTPAAMAFLSKDSEQYLGFMIMHHHHLVEFWGQLDRAVLSLDLSGRNHLLDLGGGPGTYAIQFCLKNPGLRATVFDLPTTRPFAEDTIQKAGLADRIDFLAGSYLEDTISGVYDIAWLSQILHGEGPDSCSRIVQKAVSALEPGGLIVVHEFLLHDSLSGPLFPALFSLNMLLGTTEGQAYSEGEIRGMLASAGVKEIRRLPFQGPNDSGLIVGVV